VAEAVHPLNLWDAERSKARVSDIEIGLQHPIDAWYWRAKAEGRIEALESDAETFGLVPHEEEELRELRKLLGRDEANG
jgi:hypothetical protein